MNDASPYKTPSSSVTPTAPAHYGEVKILSTDGRLGRVRYIGYSVGLGFLVNLVMVLLGGTSALLGNGNGQQTMPLLTGGLILVIALGVFVVSIMLVIQRLHDFDASGWWSVLMVVPLANLVLYLVLLIMPGTQSANRFGNPPPPNTTGVIILALILPIIMIIGIVAAIAIPAYHDYTLRAQHAQETDQQ